jgi:hypothetical protein
VVWAERVVPASAASPVASRRVRVFFMVGTVEANEVVCEVVQRQVNGDRQHSKVMML